MKNRLKSAVALALLSGGCVLASAALAGPSSVTALMGADAAGISRAALTLTVDKDGKPISSTPTSTVTPLAIGNYCERGYSSGVEPITLVDLSDISNASSASSTMQNEDFTTTVGQLTTGAAYPIEVEGFTGGNFRNAVAVYIDWNQNEIFDADESYFIGVLQNSTGIDGKFVSTTISVPPAAKPGPTRMRVAKQYTSAATPALANVEACGTSGFGQAEDYTVEITVDPNVPIPPTLGMAFAPTNGPVGDSSTLTIMLGNSMGVANALNADFTNTFPLGLEVAAIPAASTTCTSGTVTTGTNSITLGSGASIPPGGCTIEVDVTTTTAGIYVNAIAAGDLDSAMGAGPSASATYQATQDGVVNYNTGFEAPDYNVGALHLQQDWAANNDWLVSTANPGAGSQAVRGTWTTAGSGTTLMISPEVPQGTTDYSIVSAKLAITTAGTGATWDFAPQDSVAGKVITRVRFLKGAGNKIQVLADTGGGVLNYVDTGATWAAGSYFDLKFITKRSDDSYKICINNTEVYSGAGFASSVDNLAIIGNKGTGTQNNILDVDNVVINNTNWGTCALPTYTVTPSIGTGDGTTTPSGPQTVSENDTIAFTLVPDAGFTVDNVTGTCGGTLAGDVFTTDPVEEDCTVIANFKASPVTVAKTFDPAIIEVVDGRSTLTITLTNTTAGNATLTAPLVDNFPADLDTVPGTGSTTCGVIFDEAGAYPSAGTITLPAGIVIPASSSCAISVQVKSDVPGTYVNTIASGDLQTNIGSNVDGATATLTVTGHPEIAVTPASLATTVAMNATSTANLTIENIGSEDLTYSISESVARNFNPPSFRNAPVTLGSMATLASAPNAGISRRGDAYVLADFDISQMTDNSPGDQGVSCGTSGESTAPNSWWRRFYFSEHPQVGATANIKSVTVSSGSNAIPGGLPITINLYTLAHSTAVDTIPTASLTLIGTANGVINNGLASITIPVTGVVSDTVGMDLVVEYFTPGNDSGGQFFPGANATPETHPTFISSADCGINVPTKAIDVGNFPDFHLTMVVTLEESAPQACVNVTDIPWLSASPTSGTVIPGAQDTVVVTFNASGMPAGTHSANLCVNSNDDQGNELVVVPVEMTVTPSGATFEVTSSVNGGNGSITPATVTVSENDSATFTLTPDFGFAAGPVTSSCGGTLTGDTFVTGPVSAACTVEATFVALPFPAPYCDVKFPSAVEPITLVAFTGINNVSSATVGGSPALENFLSVTGGEVSLGGRYPIAVEGNTDGGFTARVRVFVDWNRDGEFDASETYVLSDLVGSTGADGKQATGEIVVPAGAVLGETRMRVVKRFSTVPGPCNTAGYGQAEDYTITINNDPLPAPEIDLDSAAFDGTGALVIPSAMVGTSASTTLDVMNVGEANSRLEYLIKRAMAERPAAGRRAVANERLRALANDAVKATAAGLAQDPVNHTDLVASAALSGTTLPTVGNVVFANDPLCAVGTPGLVVHDGDGLPQNGYGWNPAAGTDPKIVDKFTPSTYPAKYTTVCVSLLTNAGVTSAPVKVVVFADDGAGGAPGTELGRVSAVANNIGVGLVKSFQAIDISSMNLNIGSGSVYIGLEWDATAISGLFIGADESSATNAGGYSYSSAAWTPTVDGHPAYKAMFIRAIEEGAGPPGVGCDNPSSIPWLSASPTSGTVMEGDSDTITVTGNAAGMAPGNYEALLCIESNDPNTSRIDLTVKFEVTPLPPAIFSDGFEGEDPPPSPDIVTGVVGETVVLDGDMTFDFLTGQVDTWDPNRADDINLYDYGDGSLSVYWFGDMSSLDVGGVWDGTEFVVLQAGDTIGPSSDISAASLKLVNWDGSVDGYIGFAFENENTGALNYGYLRIVTTGGTGLPAQLIEYGYNKSGAAITIPNP